MQIITINLSEHFLSALQTLNDLGLYPSRSEAIRMALKDFLNKELKFYEYLEPDSFKELMRGVEH